MAADNLLRKRIAETPTIYAYEHVDVPSHKGWLKVGYTTRDVETRVREQNLTGNIQYRIVLKRPAMRKDGSSFNDKLVHRILRKDHIRNPEGEWFVCDVKKVEQAIATAVAGKDKMIDRIYDFPMRPEQERAVKKTSDYFDAFKKAPALKRAEEVGEIITEDADNVRELEAREMYDEGLMPLRTNAYLYLSGTPFRAISTGEFIEEQIYNWTYSDEQAAKETWRGPRNPYAQLPKMVMLTYQMPDSIREIASQGEFDEFDLNEFFRAEDDYFLHEEYVQKWLDLIRGAYTENIVTELKLGTEKPPMPFSDSRLLSYLQHTYWFLPSVLLRF